MMSIEQLRGMIGLTVDFRGIICRVIEVLEDGPALVLSDLQCRTSLQADQFGDPGRVVQETYVVPVFEHGGENLHDDFLSLILLDERH